MKREEISIDFLESVVFEALDLLRGEINTSDHTVILYLLQLKRDGYLSSTWSQNNVEHLPVLLSWKISQSRKTSSRLLEELGLKFFPIIFSVPRQLFFQVVCLIQSLDDETLDLNYSELFESILGKLARTDRRSASQYFELKELSELLVKIADIKVGTSVFDPFAGTSSLPIFMQEGVKYLGQEISQELWAIGQLRLLAHGRQDDFKYENVDSILFWGKPSDHWDVILATPPFGKRVDRSENPNFGPILSIESFVIGKSLDSLSETGKLVLLTPSIFLSSPSDYRLRKFLVENDLLEMVISFQGGIFHNSPSPFSVIVINKVKRRPFEVAFVAGEEFVSSVNKREKRINVDDLSRLVLQQQPESSVVFVSQTEISSFDYNLNGNRYSLREIIKAIDDGEPLGRLISPLQLPRNRENIAGKFVRIRDLKEDKIDFQLRIEDVGTHEVPAHGFKLNQSALLIATRWKTLKPTYFKYEDEPIFVSQDILCCVINEDEVDLSYLVKELHASYVLDQIEKLRSGSTIPFISKDDLKKVLIHLPAKEIQKAQVQGAREFLIAEKQKELQQLQRLHGLENEIYDQNSFLRHSISGSLKSIRSSFKSVKAILEDQVVPAIDDAMSLKTSTSRLTLKKHLEILERDINKVSQAVKNRFADERYESYSMGPLDLYTFIDNYISELRSRENLIFRVEFIYCGERIKAEGDQQNSPIFINGNAELLTILFDNLVENAEKHGFENMYRAGNALEIWVMQNYDSSVTLNFANTGKRLPRNFTLEMYVRKGSKSGPHAGDGRGGSIVNSIMKKHGGRIADLIDEINPGDEYVTSIELEFPGVAE